MEPADQEQGTRDQADIDGPRPRARAKANDGRDAAGRPALLLIGWLHWGNTSTNLARSQDPAGAPLFPVLEVLDGLGGWRRTAVEVGLPAGKTKPVVVDLTGVVDPADPRLRLTTDFEVYWDRIAVAGLEPRFADRESGQRPGAAPRPGLRRRATREKPEIKQRQYRLAPSSAELRYSGFSRW